MIWLGPRGRFDVGSGTWVQVAVAHWESVGVSVEPWQMVMRHGDP